MRSLRPISTTRTVFSLALAVCLTLAAGCGKKGPSERATSRAETVAQEGTKQSAVILRVGASYYFNSDFEAYLKRIMGNSPETLTVESRSRLFDRFVEDKLLVEAARQKGIALTDEEKNRFQSKVQEEMDSEKGRRLLPEDLVGLNEELLIEKYTYSLVQNTEVTDDEIRAHYAAHKSDFLQPERVKVSQILLKTEEKAVEVLARVKSLPEDGFRGVARQESISPEASKAGEMGTFSPGQLPYEIEKVIFSLKEGEISPIVQTSYGFHIFRLDKRFAPELVSEEQAAPGIRTKLLDEKIGKTVAAHLDELRRTLDWKASPENLPFAYQRNDS
jgi:parvulin-like peptidyl-prolyl isomerase